jgi:hypothetical protein
MVEDKDKDIIVEVVEIGHIDTTLEERLQPWLVLFILSSEGSLSNKAERVMRKVYCQDAFHIEARPIPH